MAIRKPLIRNTSANLSDLCESSFPGLMQPLHKQSGQLLRLFRLISNAQLWLLIVEASPTLLLALLCDYNWEINNFLNILSSPLFVYKIINACLVGDFSGAKELYKTHMKSMYCEFDKENLIDSSRSVCTKWLGSTCFLDTYQIIVLGKDKNDLFLVISRSRLLIETASLLVHIWTIIPLVQCIDKPVNVSRLISLLSQMKVTNLEKWRQGKKVMLC